MKIDFYLNDPQQVVEWENLGLRLHRRGFDVAFVAEPPSSGRRTSLDAEAYEVTRELLAEQRRPYLSQPRYADADAVIGSAGTTASVRHNYTGLKLGLAAGWAPLSRAAARPWVGFDAVLVHSDEQREEALAAGATSVQVCGYPRLASLLRGELNVSRQAARFSKRRGKLTIAYLSTTGSAASLERFGDAIIELGKRYHVIHKPHPTSLLHERERYEHLRRSGHVLVDEKERRISPFLSTADIVVVDGASGAMMEALYAGRTTIALDGGDTVDPRRAARFATAVPICDDPAYLGRLVDELALEDHYAQGRRALVSRLLPTRGDDDVRATTALMREVITAPERELVSA